MNETFLLSIFFIIFGIGERFANCCLTEWVDQTKINESDALDDVFHIFQSLPYDQNLPTTYTDLSGTEFTENDFQEHIENVLKLDISRLQLREQVQSGNPSTDFIVWVVQHMAVYYAVIFMYGYKNTKSKDANAARDCWHVARYLIAFVSDAEFKDVFSERFYNRAKIHKLSQEGDEAALQNITYYSQMVNKLDENYKDNSPPDTKKLDLLSELHPGKVCDYMGQIYYYGKERTRARLPLNNVYGRACEILGMIKSGNVQLTSVLRAIVMPKYVRTSLRNNGMLVLLGKSNGSHINEFVCAKKKDNELISIIGKKLDSKKYIIHI